MSEMEEELENCSEFENSIEHTDSNECQCAECQCGKKHYVQIAISTTLKIVTNGL